MKRVNKQSVKRSVQECIPERAIASEPGAVNDKRHFFLVAAIPAQRRFNGGSVVLGGCAGTGPRHQFDTLEPVGFVTLKLCKLDGS